MSEERPLSRHWRGLLIAALGVVLLISFILALGIRVIWTSFPEALPLSPLPAQQLLPGTLNPSWTETALHELQLTPTATQTPTAVPSPGALPIEASPPISQIVYTCLNSGFSQICTLDPDSGRAQRITEVEAVHVDPSLAGSGEGVFFVLDDSGTQDIYSLGFGVALERLTNGRWSVGGPTQSPDGTWLAFVVQGDFEPVLWLMGGTGLNPQPYDAVPSGAFAPAWSWDSQQLSFTAGWSGSNQLYTIPINGGAVRQITDFPLIQPGSSWSPGGNRLVFAAGAIGSRELYFTNLSGANIRRLTNGGDNFDPSWSPDGNWIVFVSFRDGNHELYIIRPDGTQTLRLTNTAASELQPFWGLGR